MLWLHAARSGTLCQLQGGHGMPTLHAVTRVSAHPNDVDDMKAILHTMIAPTRAEPGCRRWDLMPGPNTQDSQRQRRMPRGLNC